MVEPGKGDRMGPFDGDWSDTDQPQKISITKRNTSILHRQVPPPWQRTSFVGYQEWLRSEINSSVQSGVQTGIKLGVGLALDQNRIKMEKEMSKMDKFVSTSNNNRKQIFSRLNKMETNINQMREEVGSVGAEIQPINEKIDHLESEIQEIKTIVLSLKQQQQQEKKSNHSSSVMNCLIM